VPLSGARRPDNGGSTRPWNIDLLQRGYTALHPKTLSYSCLYAYRVSSVRYRPTSCPSWFTSLAVPGSVRIIQIAKPLAVWLTNPSLLSSFKSRCSSQHPLDYVIFSTEMRGHVLQSYNEQRTSGSGIYLNAHSCFRIDGVRRCLWTAATSGNIVHRLSKTWVLRDTVKWYWQGKTE
jgi:hypothetical protein